MRLCPQKNRFLSAVNVILTAMTVIEAEMLTTTTEKEIVQQFDPRN